MNCPLCLAACTRPFLEWPQFTVRHCDACAFRFIDTGELRYPRDAQYVYEEPQIGPVRQDLPHIRRRATDVLRFKRPPGSALDIGCGKGELALALRESGFDCVAIDMNARLISHAQARFPQVEWRCMEAAALAREARSFDVIAMYNVLEHVPDPRALLATVRSLAKPEALVAIEVPNLGGWEARIKGRHWHYYKVDHVSYFAPTHLRRLADEAGFEVLGMRGYQHFSWPQDVAWKDLAKSALAALGFKDVLSVFLRPR